jgi:hypothetical protein
MKQESPTLTSPKLHTRQVSLVEQELPTLPKHLTSAPFSGVRVTRSLVLYVCFVDCCLLFCTFSFGQCVVCSSSTYGFWLPPFGIFKLFLFTKTSDNFPQAQLILVDISCPVFRLFDVLAPKDFWNYLACQSFDHEHTWRRLFQKHIVRTNLHIYVFTVANYITSSVINI